MKLIYHILCNFFHNLKDFTHFIAVLLKETSGNYLRIKQANLDKIYEWLSLNYSITPLI